MKNVSPFKVTNELRELLLGNPDITALVGENIYPIIAPADTTGNFIVYQRDGYKEQGTKTGVAWRRPLVNIACVSSNYEDSQNIARLVCDCLCGDFEEPYMHIELEDSTEDFDSKKYIQLIQFSITV